MEVSSHVLMPFFEKLSSRSALSETDRHTFSTLPFREIHLKRGDHVAYEGAEANSCCGLLSGMMTRQKFTGSGEKQILSVHMRGDIVDLQNGLVGVADHGIQAITDAAAVSIRKDALLRIMDERPAIARALLVDMIVDCSIAREWLLNVGQRTAHQRVSHLLCEIVLRERDAGLRAEDGWDMPLTQEEIGEATGMTSVHVNRMLQRMRGEGFLTLKDQKLVILDWPGLQAAGDFTDIYLHRPEPIRLHAN